MDNDWITSPAASRVLQHAEDPRPAWLWSGDGQRLIWHNPAATLFGARLKKSGLKHAPMPVPIKGQIARNIRLGSTGRSSLARIQFLAGDKPVSATCATTPLADAEGAAMLLVVAVDPIAADILLAGSAAAATELGQAPPPTIAPSLVSAASAPAAVQEFSAGETSSLAGDESATPPQALTADIESPASEAGAADPATEPVDALAAAAEEQPVATPPDLVVEEEGPAPEEQGTELAELETPLSPRPRLPLPLPLPPKGVVLETAPFVPAAPGLGPEDGDEVAAPLSIEESPSDPAPAHEDDAYQRELADWQAADGKTAVEDRQSAAPEPEPPAPEAEVLADPSDFPQASAEGGAGARLSSLVDRMGDNAELFSPLTDADDPLRTEPVVTEVAAQLWLVTGTSFVAEATPHLLAEPLEPEAPAGQDEPPVPAYTRPDEPASGPAGADESADWPADDEEEPEILPPAVSDPDAVERVSRYNFDELSRILNDRMGDASPRGQRAVAEPPKSAGSLINLGGETLVLNRLPLGILVFRDQQVMFANRAITEMVGYDSVESLRAAGLASVFPAAGPEGQEAGPVNHLVQRDGTLVPVTARLQSISWQGRPALMLSASATEVRTGHEAAVRAFAETFAGLRGDGFFETSRSGVLMEVSPRAAVLFGHEGVPLQGRPLISLVAKPDTAALRSFLERPARFAESARPCLSLRAASAGADLMLFAQGQAGVVTGYFGFVHEREANPLRIAAPGDIDPALLARISRGVRRPLNTIIGFSDLLRSEAFGMLGNERHHTYAQDIVTAGHEIAALVDELDDFTRLRDGRYLPQRASLDLTALLESCVLRIRNQASAARVIVRNAISETLPKITADRASLAQAVLNLLASAIDQTPTGGAVIISCNREDDGSIAVHVRDSSNTQVDMAERFVVFRDGVGRDGKAVAPVRSSVGLALTRSLLAVNAFQLSVDPAGEHGLLFTLRIPADLVDAPVAEAGEQ